MDKPATLNDLTNIIGGGAITGGGTGIGIVPAAMGFAGIVLFVMLLNGGFKYITSGGDPKAVEAAKNTLTFALIGMVLIASSFLILRILGQFTSVDVTNFSIYKQ